MSTTQLPSPDHAPRSAPTSRGYRGVATAAPVVLLGPGGCFHHAFSSRDLIGGPDAAPADRSDLGTSVSASDEPVLFDQVAAKFELLVRRALGAIASMLRSFALGSRGLRTDGANSPGAGGNGPIHSVRSAHRIRPVARGVSTPRTSSLSRSLQRWRAQADRAMNDAVRWSATRFASLVAIFREDRSSGCEPISQTSEAADATMARAQSGFEIAPQSRSNATSVGQPLVNAWRTPSGCTMPTVRLAPAGGTPTAIPWRPSSGKSLRPTGAVEIAPIGGEADRAAIRSSCIAGRDDSSGLARESIEAVIAANHEAADDASQRILAEQHAALVRASKELWRQTRHIERVHASLVMAIESVAPPTSERRRGAASNLSRPHGSFAPSTPTRGRRAGSTVRNEPMLFASTRATPAPTGAARDEVAHATARAHTI